MEIVECRKQIKTYIRFLKDLYMDDPFYKDNITQIFKSVINEKSAFSKNSFLSPVVIKGSNDEILAAATFIHANNYPDYLQVAFLEAKENCKDAVKLLLEKARSICRERNAQRIIFGMNGHVGYGLGFLADKYDCFPSLGSSYSKHYYIRYFEELGGKSRLLTSFEGEMKDFNLDKYSSMVKRVNSRFTFRTVNFKDFKNEMKLYTELNNECFKNHSYYYKRDSEEDYELFKDLKLFMKEESLLFAEHDGKIIGFLLWYPDFNQLVAPGSSLGVRSYLLNKMFYNRLKRMKIVEIGVLPEYRNSGVILGLFNKCYELTKGRYETFESSWILDENFRSKNFGTKWARKEYKHYKVYEFGVEGDKND